MRVCIMSRRFLIREATIISNYFYGDPKWAAWYAGELLSRVWRYLIDKLATTPVSSLCITAM